MGAVVYAEQTAQADVSTVTVPDTNLDEGLVERLDGLDRAHSKDLAWLAVSAEALRALPLALADVSHVLGLWGRSDAHRVVRLAKRPLVLRNAAVAAGVTRGHLRYLSTLPDSTFLEHVQAIGRLGLSVRGLQERLSGASAHAEADSETQHYARRIGEALGAEVQIHWPPDESRRLVRITWFTADDLSGILRRLAREGIPGVSGTAQDLTQRRYLELALRSNTELEAVLGKLGIEG